MHPILEIQNLQKIHQDSSQSFLFSQVSAKIAEPDRIALLGASGQGKSTLLKILSLLDTPNDGEILFHNQSFRSFDPRQWRMNICYVAQHSVMLPGSIEENLKAVSILHRTPYERELAQKLLSDLGLEYLDVSKNAADLSGGEKQRISLIRSMLLRPEIFLLDEITASLDQNSKLLVEQTLARWHEQEGTTMIWVTHDLQQARQVSRRVWFMGNGTLLEDTETNVFFEQPNAELARGFIHGKLDEAITCPL